MTAETQRPRDKRTSNPHQLAGCLTLLSILILHASHFLAQDRPRAAVREEKPVVGESKPLEDRILDQLIAHIAASTRALQLAESPSVRISKPPAVPPGAPPLLSFRYFEGKQRHRFGNLDLVMDDAGH